MIDFSALGHAISVHFVIALFVVSAISYAISISTGKYVIQYQSRLVARWALWAASLSVVIAIVFGLYAYMAESHDDISHHLLNKHRNVALFVGLAAIILTLWSAVLVNADKEERKGFIFVHMVATVALLYVTWTGSVLVYQFGVGVSHLPDPKAHSHRTYKKITNNQNKAPADDVSSSSFIDELFKR